MTSQRSRDEFTFHRILHRSSSHLPSQLKDKLQKEVLIGSGQTFEYKKVFLSKTDAGEYVVVEEFEETEKEMFVFGVWMCVEIKKFCYPRFFNEHLNYEACIIRFM